MSERKGLCLTVKPTIKSEPTPVEVTCPNGDKITFIADFDVRRGKTNCILAFIDAPPQYKIKRIKKKLPLNGI